MTKTLTFKDVSTKHRTIVSVYDNEKFIGSITHDGPYYKFCFWTSKIKGTKCVGLPLFEYSPSLENIKKKVKEYLITKRSK